MKKNKIISALKYVVFLFLGIGLLWYVTKNQDLHKIFNEFKTANYYWIFLSMSAAALAHILRAARWNLIIESTGYKTKLSTTFYAVMIGYFANMLVPRLGEVSRCGVLSKSYKAPFNILLGTVVAERILDSLCLLVLIVLVVFFQFAFLKEFLNKMLFQPLSLSFENNFTTFIIVASVIVILIICFYILYKTMNKRFKNQPFYLKLKRVLVGFIEGIKAIKHIKQKWIFIIYTLLMWFFYFLMAYLCFFSLSATSHLGIADGLTVMVMGSLGIVAPVPGGIGAYHFIVITTLVELFAINSVSATSFAYISHASQGVLIAVLGLFSFAAIFLLNKKAKNENN